VIYVYIGFGPVALFVVVCWAAVRAHRRASAKRDAKIFELLDPIVERLRDDDVSAEEAAPLARVSHVRPLLFGLLNMLGRVDLFPEEYLGVEAQAEGLLAYWLLHPYELGSVPDPMGLVERFKRDVDGVETEFLVFRYEAPESHFLAKDGWLLEVVGPFVEGEVLYGRLSKHCMLYKPEKKTTPEELVERAHAKWMRRPPRKRRVRPEFSQEEFTRHYDLKEAALESILGPMHDIVGHALVPFNAGGGLDMYHFAEGIPGTAMATMELIRPDGRCPRPNSKGAYELVAFTRHRMPKREEDWGEDCPLLELEQRICSMLTALALHGRRAVLEGGSTCEISTGRGMPNCCLVLEDYDPEGVGFVIDGQTHSLLLCMEIFPSEMKYAMKNGLPQLLDKLKVAGHYPYSDLDRKRVV